MRTPLAVTLGLAALLGVTAFGGPALAVKHVRVAKLSAPIRAPRFDETLDVRSFQRGNVHAHTTRSDGSAKPEAVAAWYRQHGYQFLAITDHNVRVDPSEVKGAEGPGFVLIPGDEITSWGAGVPVHVNALCTQRTIRGSRFTTREAAISAAISAVRAQGGVPLVNHPNYHFSLRAHDVAQAVDHGSGSPLLFEVWSGHPTVSPEGNLHHASAEAQWDDLLSGGLDVAGVAVDDMHHLKPPPGRRNVSLPGRAWIATYGAETTRDAICHALAEGRFYASSGARFRRIAVSSATLTVWVDDRAAKVDFIGERGEVLQTRDAARAAPSDDGFALAYTLHGSEGYVRAKVTSAAGVAWTQAFHVR